jgi:hypothetical protein
MSSRMISVTFTSAPARSPSTRSAERQERRELQEKIRRTKNAVRLHLLKQTLRNLEQTLASVAAVQDSLTDDNRGPTESLPRDGHHQAPPAPSIAKEAQTPQPPPAPSSPPAWIRERFSRQQYRLLCALWGKGDVPATELEKTLGYANARDPAGNLLRRVAETNKNLTEKAELIGEQWEIKRRTRDDVRYFYLHRDGH